MCARSPAQHRQYTMSPKRKEETPAEIDHLYLPADGEEQARWCRGCSCGSGSSSRLSLALQSVSDLASQDGSMEVTDTAACAQSY